MSLERIEMLKEKIMKSMYKDNTHSLEERIKFLEELCIVLLRSYVVFSEMFVRIGEEFVKEKKRT